MIKQVIQQIDLMLSAEIALVIFVAAFIAIFIRAVTATNNEMQHAAALPLDELPRESMARTQTAQTRSDKNE